MEKKKIHEEKWGIVDTHSYIGKSYISLQCIAIEPALTWKRKKINREQQKKILDVLMHNNMFSLSHSSALLWNQPLNGKEKNT